MLTSLATTVPGTKTIVSWFNGDEFQLLGGLEGLPTTLTSHDLTPLIHFS